MENGHAQGGFFLVKFCSIFMVFAGFINPISFQEYINFDKLLIAILP
jgi:hypothetical protein